MAGASVFISLSPKPTSGEGERNGDPSLRRSASTSGDAAIVSDACARGNRMVGGMRDRDCHFRKRGILNFSKFRQNHKITIV